MAEKILIIDDDLDTLRLVGLMLNKNGYQAVAAINGGDGLRKTNEETPDLILLDVMMPDMDGYEVARRLRKDPESSDIPILMFTAKSQLNDKVAGFEAGVDGYITKPTHPSELQTHIRTLLLRSEKTRKESINQQISPSQKATKKTTPQLDKDTSPVDSISARFSIWFKKIPPNEVK